MRKVPYTCHLLPKLTKINMGLGKNQSLSQLYIFQEELGSFRVEGFVALQVIRLEILQVCTDSIRDLAPKPFLLLSFFCLFVPPTLPSLLTSPYLQSLMPEGVQ